MSAAVSISKTVRSLQKLGLAVTGVEVQPDGTVRVLTAEGKERANDGLDHIRAKIHALPSGRAA